MGDVAVAELERSEREYEVRDVVGSATIPLLRGERVVLSESSVYRIHHAKRTAIIAEPSLSEEVRGYARWKNRGAMVARRFFGGESVILDMWEGTEDDGQVWISSDAVGSQLVTVPLEDRVIIARDGVYFGSGTDVKFRLASPFQEKERPIMERAKLAGYGPGPILQRFSRTEHGVDDQLIMNFDGDWQSKVLERGESMDELDPRHIYAWDHTVKLKLVPFGKFSDLLFRGIIRYFVKAEGPGEIWWSNNGYTNGYWGTILTPTHWAYRTASILTKPFGWVKN